MLCKLSASRSHSTGLWFRSSNDEMDVTGGFDANPQGLDVTTSSNLQYVARLLLIRLVRLLLLQAAFLKSRKVVDLLYTARHVIFDLE